MKGDKDWQNRKPFWFLLTTEVTDISSQSHYVFSKHIIKKLPRGFPENVLQTD